jgi:hypothetical protein
VHSGRTRHYKDKLPAPSNCHSFLSSLHLTVSGRNKWLLLAWLVCTSTEASQPPERLPALKAVLLPHQHLVPSDTEPRQAVARPSQLH